MIVNKLWVEENYKKFNDLYWDGKLPNNVTFKVGLSEIKWGESTCVIDHKTKKTEDYAITISNYYDSPEEVKLTTLLHEMIHIYDYCYFPEHFEMEGYDSHGHLLFLNECERLKHFGWNITPTATDEDYEVSTVSDIVIERLNKKIENGFYLLVTYPKKDGDDFSVSKLNEKQAEEVNSYVNSGLANRMSDTHSVLLKYYPKDLDDMTETFLFARASFNRGWDIENDYVTDIILNNSDKICEINNLR